MSDAWSVLTLGLGALAGGAATFAMRAIAHAIGFVSRPNPIVAQHVRTVAYLGGVAVAVGILVAFWVGRRYSHDAMILAPALLFLVLGLADDARTFSPPIKFALQAVAAGIAVAFGCRVQLGYPAVLEVGGSILWILVLVNAFNFVDVCDGLLSGITAVFFGYIALVYPDQRVLALSVSGALLGFLAFNRPRASIFLGDAGSHLLGFLAAAVTLVSIRPGSAVVDFATSLVALGVPLFEAVFITAVRIAKGLPWWRGSPDHFALRLQSRGWSTWRTVMLTWSIATVLAALALALRGRGPVAWQGVLLTLGACSAAAAWWLLAPDRRLRVQAQAQTARARRG